MSNITIVRLKHPEKYKTYDKSYGILQQRMAEISVINLNSNMGGITINVANSDFTVVPPYMWETLPNCEVIIPCCGGYIPTGLVIYV